MSKLKIVFVTLAVLVAAILAVVLLSGGGPRQNHSSGFGAPPKAAQQQPRVSLSPSYPMYDSVTLGDIPSHPFAVACYLVGSFANCGSAAQSFPHAYRIGITPSACCAARVLDVEPGDATPGQAGPWVRMDTRAGYHCPQACPSIYASISEMGSVIANLHAWGLVHGRDYLLWDADWMGVARVDAGFDATQFIGNTCLGRNLDCDRATALFLGAVKPGPPPPPPDPHGYKRFAKWELPLVQRYDGARQHPKQFGHYIVHVLEPQLFHDAVLDIQAACSHRTRCDYARYDRGWRVQQLLGRAKGNRYV